MAAALRQRLNTTPAAPPAVRAARAAAWSAAVALFVLPLGAGVLLALREAASLAAWRDLLADPQLPRAVVLSLRSALVGTGLAFVLALLLTTWLHDTAAWRRVVARLAGLLAVPHAAFAIGLAWLIAPSGGIARLVAAPFGWTAPPDWASVNDPGAWLLTAVLVLKELPFLLWNIAALLARRDVAQQWRQQRALGRSLGYTGSALWWRVAWPAWLPRLAWPLAAVLAYGLTVVDLGLVVGPQTPPTLAVLAYADLVDGTPLRQARGACAAVLLALLLGALCALAAFVWRLVRRAWNLAATSGVRRAALPAAPLAGRAVAAGLVGVYGVVVAVLVVLSFAGVWTFPAALPQRWTLDAWRLVAAAAGTVGFTVALAAAASFAALVLCIAWFEAAPPRWDARTTPLVMAPLVLPGLLLMAGLYQGALTFHVDGSWFGLWWVHLLVVLPYTYIALQPAWRSFDERWTITALTLGRSRIAAWWRVKRPLLAAPIASALAVGFAVSVAQYLATQFLGAGRHATVTTEAVTLASGGQRTIGAAFALLQALLPLAAFAAAERFARRHVPPR